MGQNAEIVFEVDHSRKEMKTIWRGRFDMTDVAENCRRRIDEGAHGYKQLIDATAAQLVRTPLESRGIGMATMRLLDQSCQHGTAGPTAIVVDNQIDYGTCRVISSYFEPGGKIAVFYDLKEARNWLANIDNESCARTHS